VGPLPVKGRQLPMLDQYLRDPATVWRHHTVALWHGRKQRLVEIPSDAAVLYHPGKPPVPIHWIHVRDPTGEPRM
jgi:hypothetical protein